MAEAQETQQGQPGECPFCKIAGGGMPAKKVYEDESILAFLDINPRNPGHTLVVPKKHFETLLDMPEGDAAKLFQIVKKMAEAAKKAVNANGVSISQSNGRAAGQMVPHAHFHVIPRFNTEGPIGLEGVLAVKKIPEENLNQMAEAVKKSLSGGSFEPSPEEPAETSEEPVKKDMFDF